MAEDTWTLGPDGPGPTATIAGEDDRPRAQVGQAQVGQAIRTAVVGMSLSPTCGVRAHAGLLAEVLGREGVPCSMHWLLREQESLRGGHVEIRAWTRALVAELQESKPDAVLLHYSVFAYAHRGLPVFVRPTLSALRSTRIPLVVLMHELVYPWMLKGWRGGVWALTQRMVLIDVVRDSRGLVVTTDFRADWLASRRWLARRPIGIAPVFSNLPPPVARPRADRERPLVGLFGYTYDEHVISLVLDAVGLLKRRGMNVELALLGAPGRASALAESWLSAASARDIADTLSFAGPLAAQDLSDALATCDVLLFVDPPGPLSRKGSLAGSLASGRPVVATDGPRTWSELVQSKAVRVVEPSDAALADAVAALMLDEAAREGLGARGRTFAQQRMGLARSGEVVAELLREVVRS